jgi:hypothetical protein
MQFWDALAWTVMVDVELEAEHFVAGEPRADGIALYRVQDLQCAGEEFHAWGALLIRSLKQKKLYFKQHVGDTQPHGGLQQVCWKPPSS